MAVIIEQLVINPILFTGIAIVIVLAGYVIYWRYLHPLAQYPGPLLASLTDLWQVHQFMTLQQPYNLTQLHERYGPIVRYGPDKISITLEEAIQSIYQKGTRLMPKTEFYDAYGAAHPNVFGMRDEAVSQIHKMIADSTLTTFSRCTPPEDVICPTASPPAISKRWNNTLMRTSES